MRRTFVALLLLLGVASSAYRVYASDLANGAEGLKLMNGQMAQEMRSRAAKLGTQTNPAQAETVYVGYTPTQFIPGWVENNNPATNPGRNSNYWQIWSGYGPELISPAKSHTYHVAYSGGIGVGSGAMWDWEVPVKGDSLQGWWPHLALYTTTANQVRPDENRPWWATDMGNTANYVLNERRGGPWTGADTNPGFRTFGVIGVWHIDDAGAPVGGAGLTAPQWTTPGTGRAAWMGLRQHGDTRFSDPLTKNPFNEDVLALNQIGAVSSSGNDKSFPGYGSQMDQLLYRDVTVPSGSDLKLDFKWRTNMSTGFGTAGTSRTGWFDKDPLQFTTGNVAPNNYISSTTSGANAPRDSFMVYVGAPVTGSTFVASNGDNAYPVFDPQHRWFAETVRANEGLYKEILSVTGNNAATTSSITVPAATLSPMLSASGGKIRVVFRVKTNRGFDDEGLTGSSLGQGAAVVDDIKSTIVATGATPWGAFGVGFESDGDIDNRTTIDALNAFKSTGKPPGAFAHVHKLRGAGLLYADLCGPPGGSTRQCNADGVIISVGNHDAGEATGGQDDGTAQRENNQNFTSPAIQLGGPYNLPQQNLGNGPTNQVGLDATSVLGVEDYYADYDLYAGVFDPFNKGVLWRYGFQSYPGNSRNQVGPPAIPSYPAWGQLRYPGFIIFNPDQQCFRDLEPGRQQSLIKTSNSNNVPDSVRITLGITQQCWRFGVTSGCAPTDGAYFDNVSLAIINREPAPLAYDGANWGTQNDAFPTNSTIAPGINAVAFDTTGAILKTGLNIAPSTNDDFRFDVPGDTTYVLGQGAGRVDMVFRILPGPGNYLTLGRTDNSNTLVGNNPSVRVALNHNDDSQFWTQYMYNPGPYGTANGHGSGARGTRVWNPNAWNSARIDTVEANAFANQNLANFVLGGPPDPGIWMATYHESEYGTAGSPGPRRAYVLPFAHNQCYVKSTTDGTQGFICDGTVPAFVACNGVGADCVPTGYQANSNVRLEGEKIIPDGLLTSGSHVEYFFRREDGGVFKGTVPDTTVVTPQVGGNSTDGDRWSEFSILPDRWKDNTYHHPLTNQPGLGNACLLVLDYNDRRGNERVWVSVADSIGATQQAGWGAHNGWHAIGGGDVNNPADNRTPDGRHAFIAEHGGQPGYRSRWDMYQVRASESLTTQAGSLGSKLGNSNPGNILDGYRSKQGATPDQLNYYKMLFIMSGDLNSGILGPFPNRSQNDCGLLTNWLQNAAAPPAPLNHAFWAMGDGFVEDAVQEEDCQFNLVADYLGVDLDNPNYIVVSGNTEFTIDVSPTNVIGGASGTPYHGDQYGLRNVCLWSNDVLLRTAVPSPNTADASLYGPSKKGPGTQFLASAARTSRTASRAYLSLVDGWDIEHLTSVNDYDTRARLRYFAAVFSNLFGSVSGCAISGTPLISLDVPSNDASLVNFMNVRNNPLTAGQARIHFGLAQADRVEVKVYDVSGRLVRNLADRQFPAGEHEILWDGLDNGGRQVARGVFFTQVRFMNSKFSAARKLTVLK